MINIKEFKGNKVLVITDDKNEKNFVSLGIIRLGSSSLTLKKLKSL
jgi:hypothetical protein